jgi:FtsP/CotA-like multicopper oxidase with cupredoxin domain
MFTSLRRRWQRFRAERQERQEKVSVQLSRRRMFQMGLMSGAALLVPKSTLLPASIGTGGGDTPTSPPTTPFRVQLPIPPIAQPVGSLNPAPAAEYLKDFGEAKREPHQYWDLFPPKQLYEMHIAETPQQFHPELPPAAIWGFNGSTPGPTFHARYGVPIVVRFRNELPPHHIGFGMPQVSIHLHNGHTAPASDGFPGNFYESGKFKDHHYLNALPGFSKGNTNPNEALSSLWYHDHRKDFTAQNVYRGLVGNYMLFDDRDSGDETDTNPQAFRLPSGEFDVPLTLTDKRFDADGELFFDPFNFDGFLGDKFLVNGAIQPFFEVARRKYRFRILNSGPSRFYGLFLSNGQQFCQLSTDGNLLPEPMWVPTVRLSVSERVDVILDFSSARIGDEILLQNRLEQVNGRGPTGKLITPGDTLMKFVVARDAADPSVIPQTMRTAPPIDETVPTRSWRFERKNGAWAINDEFFSLDRVAAFVKRDSAEIWTFQNNSGAWSHPVHIHQEEFQFLPPADTRARKDVVWLGPNQEVRTFRKFRDFIGQYPIHCHNVVHEDHAMMAIFQVIE